ncbi:MAG: bifunctional pyr operon transcriptional regulator/uracil phosphoribosyltransferase PyrR [Clostridia bacterium]|nr:bifunctional pyr operon transcriptional regulator/uracil phosphoribosyltransferase PyrR [Clostridia bacterium]
MPEHIILDAQALSRTFTRLAHEVSEREEDLSSIVIVGIKKGGEYVAQRLSACMKKNLGVEVPYASIDVSMKRDDLVSAFFVPEYTENELPFSLDDKTVVLCDDVLYTGRTVRAAIETLFSLGRPKRVLLLEVVDRGGRQLPVRADFVGKNLPTSKQEYVAVKFTEAGDAEDGVSIYKKEEK